MYSLHYQISIFHMRTSHLGFLFCEVLACLSLFPVFLLYFFTLVFKTLGDLAPPPFSVSSGPISLLAPHSCSLCSSPTGLLLILKHDRLFPTLRALGCSPAWNACPMAGSSSLQPKLKCHLRTPLFPLPFLSYPFVYVLVELLPT